MTNLSRLLLNTNLLPSKRLGLLRRVAAESAALGMPVYLVGGFVRDLLLARPVNDFDLVIEGDAVKFARKLAKEIGGKAVTHPKFGTATWSYEDWAIDLVTARSESYKQPGALPTVKLSTIDDDLRRRDFTINSMAIRLDGGYFGELHDPLGGQADLKARLIRVLHPRSFLDDPTRMIRAIRYAERYHLKLAPDTLDMINDEARAVLKGLSGERLRNEFDLLFEEKYPAQTLARLSELNLLYPVHTALSALSFQPAVFAAPPADWGDFKTADILSVQQTLGWLIWLMSLGKHEIDSVADRLSFPAVLTKAAHAASGLSAELNSLSFTRPSQWTFYLDDFPALSVYAVYLRSGQVELKEYLSKWQFIRPHLTGEDLKARGLKPGPAYQRILSRLRAARLDGEVETRRHEVSFVDELIQERLQ